MYRIYSYALKGICVVSVVCLCACSFTKPSQTNAEIRIAASTKLNLDSRGRSTPVAVRIYELRNTAAFNAADFFSIYEREQQVLGDALITREEFLLQPGETRALPKRKTEAATHFGVLVAFRNIDKAAWRASTPLSGGKVNDISITVSGDTVGVTNSAK